MVFSITYPNGKNDYWQSTPLRYFLDGNHEQLFYYKQSLPDIGEGAKLKVYIWNPEQEDIRIKDLEIYLYEPSKWM